MNLTRRNFLWACVALGAGAVAGTATGCSADPPAPTVQDVARTLIDQMSVEAKAAQLFIVTPEQLAGVDYAVQQADDVFLQGFDSYPACGLILFGGNIDTPAQTRDFLAAATARAVELGIAPPLCGVDEEGGPVQRIGGRPGFDAPFVEDMAAIGATGDASLAAEAAHGISAVLRDLGFNVDFAPSCDIASSPESVMRRRSFGSDAELVSKMVVAQVEAFGEEGMLCCAKHFPGIGDPRSDSHVSAISSEKTREELEYQLMPFKAAIAAGVPLVMMGHLALPNITGSAIPASISPDIVQGILRDELGYDGVVVTDSLGMGALLEFCEPGNVGVAAIEAGCDIALMPPDFPAAYDGLVGAINAGRISMERVDESLVRILTLKLRSMPQAFDEVTQELLAQCE